MEEATRNLAMPHESYERDDRGNVARIQELERRAGISEQQVAHILKRSDEQLRFEKLLNTLTFNVGRQSHPNINRNIL